MSALATLGAAIPRWVECALYINVAAVAARGADMADAACGGDIGGRDKARP